MYQDSITTTDLERIENALGFAIKKTIVQKMNGVSKLDLKGAYVDKF